MLFKKRMLALVGLGLLSSILVSIPPLFVLLIGAVIGDITGGVIIFLGLLLCLIPVAIIANAWGHIFLAVADDQPLPVGAIFAHRETALSFLAVNFLYGVIVIGGLLLLVVPGFMWMARFMLAPYYVLDRGMGPIEALHASSKATLGYRWDLFGLQGFMGQLANVGTYVILYPVYVVFGIGLLLGSTASALGSDAMALSVIGAGLSMLGISIAGIVGLVGFFVYIGVMAVFNVLTYRTLAK